MRKLTIQARLTTWYFLSFGIIFALFAGASWWAMRASLYRSTDTDLTYRIRAVVPFLQSHAFNTGEQFKKEFTTSSDSSVVGVFVQISDEQGKILYESDVLRSHAVPVLPAGAMDGSIATMMVPVTTPQNDNWPVRVATRRVTVGGTNLNIHVVEPLHDILDGLREYALFLIVLFPIALVVAIYAGYWISRRALSPVEQLRKEADAIEATDLTARLQVPPTNDELARLAQTLNSMLARIEGSFRSIERFTADASHELRAPLALILTASEVSLRRERTREELAQVVSKIVREARHMSALVENLLATARGDTNERSIEAAPVDIVQIMRELADELAPLAKAKGLSLSAALPDHEIHVVAEGIELRRLFLILLDNAIKYTESGSVHFDAAADASNSNIVVKVTDTGVGINSEALPHIFDRFWRADQVRSRSAAGVGLGLSLASQIVQRLGGTIAVESEPGHGASFTVKLKASVVSTVS